MRWLCLLLMVARGGFGRRAAVVVLWAGRVRAARLPVPLGERAGSCSGDAGVPALRWWRAKAGWGCRRRRPLPALMITFDAWWSVYLCYMGGLIALACGAWRAEPRGPAEGRMPRERERGAGRTRRPKAALE